MHADSPTLLDVFDRIARLLGGTDLTPGDAHVHPAEELLIGYVIGRGRFSDDRKSLYMDCKAYKLNGEDDGTYVGVDEPAFRTIGETLERPKPPGPPFDAPAGPVEEVMPLLYSTELRTFPDGSSLTAVGPANVHAVMYEDGATNLWVTANLIVTNGTGRYAGAHGMKTVAASTWVEPGTPLTKLREFDVKTVEVYRIVRGEYVAGS